MKYVLLIFILTFVVAVYASLYTVNKFPQFSRPVSINLNETHVLDLDSITVVATTQYQANSFKKFMQGRHYRKAWETPIKVPVLNMNSYGNGLTPIKKGGGKQTKSLKLSSKDSFVYSLRSVNKFPQPLVPDFAKKIGLSNIVIDGISAQHPYAALIVANLSSQIGLLNTQPQLYFVPKQNGLNTYNDEFGNKLYLLEFETENKNFTHLENVKSVVETDDLLELKQKHMSNVSIDKAFFIKSRLFDFIIGDWDRHAKQWGWVLVEESDKLVAKALAADRDNAFFYVDGVIPSIISNRFVVSDLQAFEKQINYVPALVEPNDRYFLQNTSEKIFITQAQILQRELTDEIIENAFKIWPKTFRDLDANTLIEKIKSRRNQIVSYAKTFKAHIDKKGLIEEPLKGCEDLNLISPLQKCFDCNNQ
ncbi:hypothetical protein C7H52_10335 [Aurantibacter aestuarii]|uniref:Uncharacterized protein n=1 Tax=Aurantibacter aestuarii TaxID=1266046 RepID=A0A2T1NAA6_9FLAO|nr:hypothetical protein C7H52_10335 [Aurantibacter aestuarii]